MTAYVTTPQGVRYKFVDCRDGVVLLVDGVGYDVGEACRYDSREFGVAGYTIAGTSSECEVWQDADKILFEGSEERCWAYVIDLLGQPHSGWEGFPGHFYTEAEWGEDELEYDLED